MENTNPYEKKYKQMSMLGKGNYGNTDNTQEKSIKHDSTMEKRKECHLFLFAMFTEGLSDIKSAYGEVPPLKIRFKFCNT